jgi:nitrate/nitrite-specific signal transduction histidine kinase
MYSLKRLVWLAFVVVSVLLAGIMLLGGYQYRMAGGYSQVISQNESALFHFMTIRETITETLIGGDWERLERVNSDIEKLNSELSRLKENKLISAELKLALVDKIDLTGLAILLRQVITDPDRLKRSKQLQVQLRSISDFLLQYDRIIVGQAREQIVNFQMVVIGALGLIISLASFSLILLYRNTVSPLLLLSRQMQSDTFDTNTIELGQPVAKEVADLALAIEQLALRAGDRTGQEQEHNGRDVEALLAETVNETTNRLNGIINYAQLLYDSSEQLQVSEEQVEMLQKIIDSGVHIAGEWQKIK